MDRLDKTQGTATLPLLADSVLYLTFRTRQAAPKNCAEDAGSVALTLNLIRHRERLGA